MKTRFRTTVLATLFLISSVVAQQLPLWENIDDGFSMVECDSPVKSDVGDSRIVVIRIDP